MVSHREPNDFSLVPPFDWVYIQANHRNTTILGPGIKTPPFGLKLTFPLGLHLSKWHNGGASPNVNNNQSVRADFCPKSCWGNKMCRSKHLQWLLLVMVHRATTLNPPPEGTNSGENPGSLYCPLCISPKQKEKLLPPTPVTSERFSAKDREPGPNTIWLWVKNRYPKWNPGKCKYGRKPAGPWWLNFDPHPFWLSCV